MANDEDVARLRQGIAAWNNWREQNCKQYVDLSGADLKRADLSGANLGWANFSLGPFPPAFANPAVGNLSLGCPPSFTDLTEANLNKAELVHADLSLANVRGADLSEANLGWANFSFTDLTEANLQGASLEYAVLVDTDLTRADLTGCRIYGISAWDVKLEEAKQRDLVITPSGQPKITVDNLEVGQFIYLLLHNKKISNVIDTITSKVVLILGRFTPERKAVLDALREEIRKHDYLPVLFDFDKPGSKDLTGTVSVLANMARFIIADLTDPSCIPHELAMIMPTTVVPLQPILLEGMREYAMFIDLKKRYHWVLKPYSYNTQEHLLAEIGERVIRPAEGKVRELRG